MIPFLLSLKKKEDEHKVTMITLVDKTKNYSQCSVHSSKSAYIVIHTASQYYYYSLLSDATMTNVPRILLEF